MVLLVCLLSWASVDLLPRDATADPLRPVGEVGDVTLDLRPVGEVGRALPGWFSRRSGGTNLCHVMIGQSCFCQ